MRLTWTLLAGIIILASLPSTAGAQAQQATEIINSLPEALGQALARRSESLGEVGLYMKMRRVPGIDFGMAPVGQAGGVTTQGMNLDEQLSCLNQLCEAFIVEQTDIPGVTIERVLSPTELQVLAARTDSEFLTALGDGLLNADAALNSAISGSPFAGLFNTSFTSSGISGSNVLALLGFAVYGVARDVAEAERSLATSNQQAQAEADFLADVLPQLESAGEELFNGTPTFVVRGNNLTLPMQQVDGQEFGINSATINIDRNSYAIVRQRFEGTAVQQGQTRDFYIEVEFSDFQNPPGCGAMIEPFQRTMRMGGVLDDEQMEEMEEARAQLAEFEQQLAAMPAQQRAQVERMMGSQMETMRAMVNTGAIEVVDRVENVLCNPDVPALFAIGGGAAPEDQTNLIRQIQEYLVILGYEPGNIDGILDDLTVIAISQFQAENSLPVDGEPSTGLLGVLAERVGA